VPIVPMTMATTATATRSTSRIVQRLGRYRVDDALAGLTAWRGALGGGSGAPQSGATGVTGSADQLVRCGGG